jgi:hypothetical protein
MSLYTNEEAIDINEAWFALERLVESDYQQELTLSESLKYESKFRHITNAKALILREVLNCKSIKKQEAFAYSKGVSNCIVMAWAVFYCPITQEGYRIRYNQFKKLAKKAVKSHDNAIERKLDANTSS